jgi:collagenase-like PrtC family protease
VISYSLPDFANGLARNLFFIRLSEEHPECFADGIRVRSVYGCFPSCILNGGRTFIRERYSRAQMEETFALLDAHRVTARLTLTNMLVTEEHLHDSYLLEILDSARGHNVEVIVYSDLLSAFIKERYGFRQILSTTRAIDDVAELNRLAEGYDYVVLDYNRNRDHAFIEGIRHRERIEVMVNEFCRPACPHRTAHYRHNSRDQLDGMIRPFRNCDAGTGGFFAHAPDHPVILTDTQVRALSDRYGISHFKIVGRGVPFETVLESYVYYLLKPRYRDAVNKLARLTLKKHH